MADPLSITASVLAIVTAAVQSVKSLHSTVSRYKGRDRTLQRLQNELKDVSGILDSFKDAILAEASISALLEGPVERCSQLCKEFEQSMLSFSEKSKTGIRDWVKLEFMRGDTNEFIDTIAASTIAIGLGIITLYEALKDYNDVIQSTVHDLNVHLQRVNEKLEDFSISSSSNPGIDLNNEKEITKQRLQTALEHPDDNKERLRLPDDINASRQCLEICKMASEVSSQKIYRVGEVFADGNSDQVVANTLADRFNVKRAISKGYSARLLGSMSGRDLRVLAEQRYASLFGAFAPESGPVIHA